MKANTVGGSQPLTLPTSGQYHPHQKVPRILGKLVDCLDQSQKKLPSLGLFFRGRRRSSGCGAGELFCSGAADEQTTSKTPPFVGGDPHRHEPKDAKRLAAPSGIHLGGRQRAFDLAGAGRNLARRLSLGR
jgi:hypothetical protein